MVILQSGQAKSGNFFLYKILQNILRESRIENKNFIQKQPIYEVAKTWKLSHQEQIDIDVVDFEAFNCFYRISSVFKMPIENLELYLQETNHVWTHSQINRDNYDFFKKFDKIVYIIRDPRDVAISMSKFKFSPYMQRFSPNQTLDANSYLNQNLDREMKGWVNHVGGYLKYRNNLPIYFVFYERLLADLRGEIIKLLDFLKIELSHNSIMKVIEAVSFKKMQADAPNHVRKGKANQWVTDLSTPQKKSVNRIAKPMLELLNYPTTETVETETLPYCASNITLDKVNQAVKTANINWLFNQSPNRLFEVIKNQINN